MSQFKNNLLLILEPTPFTVNFYDCVWPKFCHIILCRSFCIIVSFSNAFSRLILNLLVFKICIFVLVVIFGLVFFIAPLILYFLAYLFIIWSVSLEWCSHRSNSL